ncbi:SET domain-containing protein [Rhizoclosmatium globosum]|uniref:SET domain-containing protein n=1 Tax=Rhizoclosmatium globosum TaxID=329046 RepID=A0A1Y2BK78_9FUNG|nr:SET domain-containing protein [Rhizoclosmatium globosum]|eukprot:ORY35173.1 SET domain-containing protein [Rhizoclosmatium globosum]
MAKASDPIIASYASKYPKSDWVSIIAAFVLLHRNDPLWQPYLAFLPTNYSTPLYWTTEELTVIDGTDLSVDLVGQRDEIQREWNQWKSLLDLESSKESLGLRSYPVAPLNYDAFLISWHHIMSRVWTLPVGDLTNKAVMIPMVDVANHYGKPKVKIEYNKEKGAVTMTATQPIKAGEQVDVTYGEDSSYKSLKYMGFTIPNNDRNEDCRIQLIRGPHDSFPRPKKWCLFHANHKLEKTIQSCHMGKPMELETLTRVRDLVITKLRSYPTSIKADTEILKSGEGSTNFVNGVRERRGEKVCLVAVRKRLDSLIKSKKK